MALRSKSDPAIPIGPHWLIASAHDVTALGSFSVLVLVVLSVVALLMLLHKWRMAIHVLLATLSGVILVHILKLTFARHRPDAVPGAELLQTMSFPSGHSTMSAVVYLTLGALSSRILPNFATRAHVMLLALLVTALVGVSRVYLGVHWPSDVLAGWSLGAAWALLCWAAAEWLGLRSKP